MNTRNATGTNFLILCDFDGTVSTKDTVNRLVREHILGSEWRFHVKRYMRGEIGSKEVYEEVGPTMRMDPAQLREFVQRHAELDPGFPAFLEWARELGIDVKIVSDGFDATIHALLDMHGIGDVEIFANRLEFRGNGRVTLGSPHSDSECGRCGTCKRGIVERFRNLYDKIVLIGDGESDRHAAAEADVVVALNELFVYCARRGIPAIRADGFGEIPHLLTRRIDAIAFDMDGTLIDSLETITDSFNHMFTVLGYPLMTVEEVARKTSISLKDFVHSYLKPEEAERGISIFRDYYDAVYLEKTSLMPGVTETLESLDGKIVKGVVTNKRGHYARRLADEFSLTDGMARIIGAQDGFRAKPAGDMFVEFMRSAGTTCENTVYVGDSPIDVHAARNACIDAFAVAGPIFSAEELALNGARRVLRSIEELPEAILPVIP
ncbi:MAG: HAD family hydrolase [Desulfomonilaceae bacterium]|nr:HAD family hydrolase [Desulfomonilaceae bacterium]